MSWYRLLLIGTYLPFCWLAMQAVHELGHVSAAVGTGGTVSQVILHPLKISRTDLADNPHPLIVAWLGPLIGVAAPLGMLVIFKIGNCRGWYLVQFFAGFCLIANGVYIGIGSLEGIGDAGDLINHGSPLWCLWLFGLISVPLGLFLWNGLGSHFGLGRTDGEVSRQAAFTSCGLFISIVVAEVMLWPLRPHSSTCCISKSMTAIVPRSRRQEANRSPIDAKARRKMSPCRIGKCPSMCWRVETLFVSGLAKPTRRQFGRKRRRGNGSDANRSGTLGKPELWQLASPAART